MANNETKPMRKSVIKRSITRTLQTAQFESLVIQTGFEEEIEWTTLSERQTKVDNWNTLCIKDFQESSDRILKGLGLDHKKAWFNKSDEKTGERYKTQIKQDAVDKGIELDDLDTLG
jgi:hypothetical protein